MTISLCSNFDINIFGPQLSSLDLPNLLIMISQIPPIVKPKLAIHHALSYKPVIQLIPSNPSNDTKKNATIY